MEERIRKLFEVSDVVKTEVFEFYREEDGTFTMYENGLEVERLSQEKAARRLIRLMDVYILKTLRGIIYLEVKND